MRVLLSISHWGIGGAQVFAIRLAEGLLDRGHEMYVYESDPAAHDASGDTVIARLPAGAHRIGLPRVIERLGARIDGRLARSRLRSRPWTSLKARHFRSVLRRKRIDLVHSHLFDSDRFVAGALRDTSVPLVISDHGDYRFVVDQGRATRAEVEAILRRTNAIAFPSASNAATLDRYGRRPGLVQEIIPYGVPPAKSGTQGNVARQALGIPETAFVFGMAARGIPEKGWAEALRGFAQARTRSTRDAHLILVGGGACLSALRAAIESDPEPHVHFVGHTDDPSYWIESFDVGLLPSYFPGESLPNSVIEYLMLGKPVIATDIGGILEMLTTAQGPAGLLVQCGEDGRADPGVLADAMLRYVADPELLAAHATRAREAASKFDMSTCVTAYECLFAQAANARAATPGREREARS